MSDVPDSLPPGIDLGDPREPTTVVNRMIEDLAKTLRRYSGAVDEAQVMGALELLKFECAMGAYLGNQADEDDGETD